MKLKIKQLRRLVESVLTEDSEWASMMGTAQAIAAAANKLQGAVKAKDRAAFDAVIDELRTEVNF